MFGHSDLWFLRFREGVILHELGRLAESRQAYLDVLAGGEERHFASVDRGLTGFKARQNLAVLATDMGDLGEAERQWREVVRAVSRYRIGWRGLGETLISGGRFAEAGTLAEELMNEQAIRVEGLLLKSRIGLKQKRFAHARAALEEAAAEYPHDLEVLRGRCQFLFEHGEPAEAERALRSLIDHDPDDASAHHNLGTLFLRMGRYDEAVRACRQAVRYRPNHAATYLNLGYALKESGRIEEAAGAWEQALRLAPGDAAAREALLRAGRAPPV
jgi:tetratricopeptide (TPR) repeat protein